MKGYVSSGNSCCISNCLSSSRENTIKRLGLYCAITVLMKCLPKLPVPPVTSTVRLLRSIQGWVKSRNGAQTAADGAMLGVGMTRAGEGLMAVSCLGTQH